MAPGGPKAPPISWWEPSAPAKLLRVAELLGSTGDTRTAYVDVSRYHDIQKDLQGVLLVLAGLELAKLVRDVQTEDVKLARKQFRRWAYGYTPGLGGAQDLGESILYDTRYGGWSADFIG